MASSVVQSLKNTPKGKLTYGCKAVSPPTQSPSGSSFDLELNDRFKPAFPLSSFFLSPPSHSKSTGSNSATSPPTTPASSKSTACPSPSLPATSRQERNAISPVTATETTASRPHHVSVATSADVSALVAAASELSLISDVGDSRVHDYAGSSDWSLYQEELHQRKRDLDVQKRKKQGDLLRKFDKFKAMNETLQSEKYRQNQERTNRRLDTQQQELEEIERQMDIEMRRSDAEYERKQREMLERFEREKLEAKEQERRLLEAQRQAEEEARQKQQLAQKAAALLAQYNTIRQCVSGPDIKKFFDAAPSQQLLDGLKQATAIAQRIEQAPSLADQSDLEKLTQATPHLRAIAEQLVTHARSGLDAEKQRVAEQQKALQQQQQLAISPANAASAQSSVQASASPLLPPSTAVTPTSAVASAVAASASPVKTTAEASPAASVAIPEVWRGALTPATCARYLQLTELLTKTEDKLAAFKADDSQKMYRLKLSRTVITTVNTVSSQSADHMLGRVEQMLKILNGKPVTMGNATVTANDHPDAMLFCTNILAQHIVMQGEKQVASHAESAFCFAAVIVGVWDRNKLFGDLLLAHMYRACPITVPFYPPRLQGHSEVQYLKVLGYKVKDDKPETNDQFTTRMAGFMRLYSAIMQTSPRPGVPQNPHGMGHAWMWLARVCNLKPRPVVTAAALCALLEMAGHAMKDAYRSQFDHMLRLLYSSFLPQIDSITSKDDQGPTARLRQTLEGAMKQGGHFSKPDGHIPPSYWTSRPDYNEPTQAELISGNAFANLRYDY